MSRIPIYILLWALAGLLGLRLINQACERILSIDKLHKAHPTAYWLRNETEHNLIGTLIVVETTGPMVLIAALCISGALMRKKWRDDAVN